MYNDMFCAIAVAVECRLGHHSTSDDSSAYRTTSEVRKWEDFDQPITRLGRYMQQKGWMTPEAEKALRSSCRKNVSCLRHAIITSL